MTNEEAYDFVCNLNLETYAKKAIAHVAASLPEGKRYVGFSQTDSWNDGSPVGDPGLYYHDVYLVEDDISDDVMLSYYRCDVDDDSSWLISQKVQSIEKDNRHFAVIKFYCDQLDELHYDCVNVITLTKEGINVQRHW